MRLHSRAFRTTDWTCVHWVLAAFFLLPASAWATHPCTSPLILDLNGDGRVMTVSRDNGVEFDMNGDGALESIGWTYEDGEGFLWLDLDHDGQVSSGRELFGDSTLTPTGEEVSDGFEALAIYDREELGGDSDGLITKRDLIWNDLRLWVDANHDGISEPAEIFPLQRFGVVAIGLAHTEIDELDGAANRHVSRGFFLRRSPGPGGRHSGFQVVDDVQFSVK
jgi:hypothetical protein